MSQNDNNTVEASEPLSNTTMMLKGLDISSNPDIQVINEIDFKKYVYTGYKVVIKTPLVKDSERALFSINLDGFIPNWSLSSSTWGMTQKNLAAVQPLNIIGDTVKVYQEQLMLPVQHLYYSNRFTSGNVNVGLRVTSNTSQSGNFFIAQGTSMVRRYSTIAENYTGIRFANASGRITDYSVNNFALVDASLNRQFSVKTTRRNPTKVQDMMKKLVETSGLNYGTIPEILRANVIASQFAEDHLLIGLLGDLPNQNANEITISVFFDYSDVNFHVPVLPIIPAFPTDPTKTQLDYNASMAVSNLPTKVNAVFTY